MQKAALLFALIALPLAAEEQSTPEGEETQKVESTPLPGTSNSPVLPGMGHCAQLPGEAPFAAESQIPAAREGSGL
jgi:hypothetical protein